MYEIIEIVTRFVTGTLSALLLFDILIRILPVKRNKIIYALLFFTVWAAIHTIVYIGDPVNILFLFPLFSFSVIICFRAPIIAKTATILIVYALIMSFSAIVDTYITIDFNNIIKLIYWFAIWIIVRRFMDRGGYSLSFRLWLLLLLLSIMPFAAIMSTVILSDNFTPVWALGVLPFAAISSLSLMAAIVILANNEKLEKEKSLWEMKNQYYKNLESSQIQIRKMRHDMANHLTILQGLEESKSKEYLESLIKSQAMTSGTRWSENEIINVLLSAKVPQMEALEISFEFNISIPKKISIDDIDLCAVYGNSLDNAIEACEKVEANKRKITMSSKVDENLLLFKISNSAPNKIHIENGEIKTDKKDKEMHGLGLTSIREVTEKYNGVMNVESDEDLFTLLISMFLK